MQIIMPKLGLTMTHGTITEWLKAPGDAVKAEEALCAYETEKVTLELSAPEDGVLAEILAPAGTTVPAGAAVCEFVTKDEGRRTKDGGRESGRDRNQGSGVRRQATEGRSRRETSKPPTSNLQPLTATPKARALARQAGVDLATVAGSGPAGRVQAADVLAVGAGLPAPATAPAEIKATPLARRIAVSEGVDLRSHRRHRPRGDDHAGGRGAGGQASGDRGQGSGVRGKTRRRECAIRSTPASNTHQRPENSSSPTPPSAAPSPSG